MLNRFRIISSRSLLRPKLCCLLSDASSKPPTPTESPSLPSTTEKSVSEKKSAEVDSDKSLTARKEDRIYIGPDNIPYNPRDDPYFYDELLYYKYPQYFTKDFGNKRTLRVIKDDISIMKKGRIHKTREELGPPHQADVCIFGGGIIGTAVAYFIKERAPFSLSVAVIERDPTFTRASTTLSVGGIRQQFSLPENILMSLYGAEFLRNAKHNLSILNSEPPDVSFTPQGYLTLADESRAQELMDNHKLQIELGALVELYSVEKLKQKFPMLNLDGVVLGSYGVQNEGWFDPWALLLSLKAKAQCLGVEFVHADVVDFNFKYGTAPGAATLHTGIENVNYVVFREPDGNVKQIQFCYGVICTGPNSPFIAKLLGYGKDKRIFFPIEARKRYVYAFNCKDGPGLNFPFLTEGSTYCRREGLGGNFVCGTSPDPDEEPDIDNLDIDYSFFENKIAPKLAHRVPAFESIKLKGAWSGFYDYNYIDQSPIIGQDLFYQNLLWATGFGGHGIQMAPAVGRAIMELVVDNKYKTIDLNRFGWNRIVANKPLKEAYNY